MKNLEQITQALQILLMEYEYVIIPNFGGFITQYQPSQLLEDKGVITPPKRIVSFNAQLTSDDGLLINFLTRFYQIDIKEAQKKVKDFTQTCFTLLDKGAKIRLDKIGVLIFDKELNIQFSSYDSENYNPYSYGLIDVSYTRLNKKEKLIIKEKKIRASKYYPYVAILLPLVLIFWISSFYLNQGQSSNESQKNGKASLLETSITPTRKLHKEEIKTNQKDEDAVISQEIDKKMKLANALSYVTTKPIQPKKESSILKPKIKQTPAAPVKKQVTKKTNTVEKNTKVNIEVKLSSYRLVAGSFKNKDNAYRLSRKIKKLNYPATVIRKGSRYRVIAVSFNNKKEATKTKLQLKKLKITTWIHHQK